MPDDMKTSDLLLAEEVFDIWIANPPYPDYGGIVNNFPELFCDVSEWIVLDNLQGRFHYPRLNELGKRVFNILYASGKCKAEIYFGPDTLQTYFPSVPGLKFEDLGALKYGLLKEKK